MSLRAWLWAWLGPPPWPAPQVIVTPPQTITIAAPEPETGLCGSCRFWQRVDKTHGECHHTATVVYDLSTLNRPLGIWGLTKATDWCGAFRRG